MANAYPPGTGGSRWEGTPALTALLVRCRRVIERHGPNASTTFRGSDLDEVRRLLTGFRAVSSLSESATVPMPAVDEWLSRPMNGGRGLLEVLGPIRNFAVENAESAAYRENAERDIDVLLGERDWCESWLRYLRAAALTKLADTPHIVNAAKVLAELPAAGITLTRLVERATGDTKALSRTPAHRLTLRALSIWFDVPFADDAATRRRLWSRAGVVVDSLSSRALVLGLRGHEDNVVSRWLDSAADKGIPFVLMSFHLDRYDVTLTAPEVFVCENPSVMEAAARELGPECAPLICTEGQPSSVIGALLDNYDGQVHWRGDFDWTGLRTTQSAIVRYAARPWRMTTATYEGGVARGFSEPLKPDDAPALSAWDPALAEAMLRTGRAVMEERIIDDLIADLDRRQA